MKKDKKLILKDEIINNNKFKYHYSILKLLDNNILDELVNKITNVKTKLNSNTLTKTDYLNGNEQFLLLLSNFIYTFKEDFYFLNNNFDYITSTILKNKKYTKFLLCKKYIGNNKYLNYYSYNIKRLVTYGFYKNIKKLAKKSNTIKNFAKENKLNLRKNLIESEKDIEILYNTLIEISICNAKELNNILLFEDINDYIEQIEKKYNSAPKYSIYNMYVTTWEKFIENYYKKKEATKILLK